MHMRVIPIIDFICWIAIDILNLLNETKLNYWFKHLLNCLPTSLTNKHNDHKKESDYILIYSPLFIVYLYLIVLSPKSLRSI
jgi:hypothetical protein